MFSYRHAPTHKPKQNPEFYTSLYDFVSYKTSHKHTDLEGRCRNTSSTPTHCPSQHTSNVKLNTPPIALRDKAKLEWIKIQSHSKVHQHPCWCNYFHNKQVESSFMEPQLIVSGQIPWEISQHALRLIIRKVEKKAADTQRVAGWSERSRNHSIHSKHHLHSKTLLKS